MAAGLTATRRAVNRRDVLRMGLAGSALGVGGALLAGATVAAQADGVEGRCSQIEPGAGNWKTWVIPSGRALRVPPPPGPSATHEEIEALRALNRNAAAIDLVKKWDAGAAGRWSAEALDMINTLGFGINPLNGKPLVGLTANRNVALVMVAIYDATIAAWDSKYAYNRRRPSQVDPRLTTVIENPESPSYPSEHAAIAAAAATVLTYLYPAQQPQLDQLVSEDVQSRLVAGVEYPSDVDAGLKLGREIGAAVVERGKSDRSGTVWTGSVPTLDPTGRNNPLWNGTNPIFPLAGTWKTWVLPADFASSYRPALYPDYFSAAGVNELNQVVNFPRGLNGANFNRNAEAFFAQTAAGGFVGDYRDINQRLQEDRLADNPPRAARALALAAVAGHDAMVACFEGKYFYWRIRPYQAHPGLATLFPTPNHPSYPAAHGAGSGAAGAMAGYLFPRDAAFFTDYQNQIAESRLWAGIHYQSDIDAGLAQGIKVAQAIIDYANHDGSQSNGAAAAAIGGCLADE